MPWIVVAPAIVLIAGALVFVLWRARGLRARNRRVFAQALPRLQEDAERLVDAPRALWHGARFADGTRLFAPAWAEACVGDLWCTAEALLFQREPASAQPESAPEPGARLAIPLAWVEEAALVRGFAPLAGKELPMLRLRFRRGGELLEAQVSLRGGMAPLEQLRREIHLRQGNVRELLLPLLQRPPP